MSLHASHLRHQDNARRAAAEKVPLEDHTLHLKTTVHGKLHEAARSNITDKQRARLHKLDEKHHEAIYGESKESMCSNHAERLQTLPEDSPLKGPVVKDYVDCLCDRNEPSIVCQAKHGEAVKKVTQHIADHFANAGQMMDDEIKQDMQQMVARSGIPSQATFDNVSDVGLARQDAITFGPCKQVFSCKFCVGGVCYQAPFPKDTYTFIKGMFGRSVMSRPPCINGDCSACMALYPPKEPVQFKASLKRGY